MLNIGKSSKLVLRIISVHDTIQKQMFMVFHKRGIYMEKDFRFLMYNSEDEDISVNAVVKGESVWLTQKGMAELFGCSADNISLHLKNIFTEGELSEIATT